MLLSEVAVMERHEHHARRHDVTYLRRSDDGSTTRDNPNTIAIENAALIGVVGVDGHKDSRGSFVELRRLPCFCSRVPMVGLTTADRDRRELFIRKSSPHPVGA